MTHLVTGASGFCGKQLLKLLRARWGHNAIGHGRCNGPDIDVASDLIDAPGIHHILEAKKPTRIYHLAGSFTNEWMRDIKANVETTHVLLETIRSLNLPCRVLLVGSAAEYGNVPPKAVHEDTPLRPDSIYGFSKTMQTELMQFYRRRFGLDVVLARPFNLFGEGCSAALFPGHVEQQIARVKAGTQNKIRVGDLSSERDYLPVIEAMRAYIRIIEHGATGEAYNVASGTPIRMSDFLALLLKPHGLTMEDVESQPPPPGRSAGPKRVFADIRKLAALPGKVP